MTAPLFSGRSTPALDALLDVAVALGPLAEQVVFIGGAIAPLLQSHPISPRVRPTMDVDGLAVTTTYAEFHGLQKQLSARGFRQPALNADAAPHANRWVTPGGTLFDLVPAGTHLGGSGNALDQLAVETAISVLLQGPAGEATTIRHVSAPTFLALKWVAFGDRGAGDLLTSHDVEDMLAVFAARPALVDECRSSPVRVRSALMDMATAMLANDDALGEMLQAHVVVDRGRDAPEVHRRIRGQLQLIATLP